MSLIKDELIKSLEANYIETIRNGFYEGTAVRALIPPLHENETKKVREARNTIPKILDSYLNQRNFNGRTGLRLTPFMVTDTLLIETDDSAKGTLYSEANNNGNVTEVFSTQDSVDASQTDSEGQHMSYVQSPGIRRMALLKRTGYEVTEDDDDFIIKCEYELRTLDYRALRNKYHRDNKIAMEHLEAGIIDAIGRPNANDDVSFSTIQYKYERSNPITLGYRNHPSSFITAVRKKWALRDRMATMVNELFSREGEDRFVTCAVMNKHCARIFVSLNNKNGIDRPIPDAFAMHSWDGEITSLPNNGITPPVTPFEMTIKEGPRRNMLAGLLAIDYLSPVPYLYEILKPSLMTQVLWFAEYFSDEHHEEEIGTPRQATLYQRDSGFGEGGENYSNEYFIKLEGFNEIDNDVMVTNRAFRSCIDLLRQLSKMKFTQILVDADSDRRLSIDSKAIKLHRGTQRAELPLMPDVVEMDEPITDGPIEDVTIGGIYLTRARNITDNDYESLRAGKTVFERLVPYGNKMSIVVTRPRGMKIGAYASISTLRQGVWIVYPNERVVLDGTREFSLSDYYQALDETRNWSVMESKSRLGYSETNTRTVDGSSMRQRFRKLNVSQPNEQNETRTVPALRRRRRGLSLKSKNEEE